MYDRGVLGIVVVTQCLAEVVEEFCQSVGLRSIIVASLVFAIWAWVVIVGRRKTEEYNTYDKRMVSRRHEHEE